MDEIATIWLDNPPVNAITAEVAAAVTAELEWIGPETRVVVIRGKGEKAFSAGADLKSITGDGKPPVGIQPLADLIEELPIPVVAAIHGHCLGGGLEVALACDIRIAHPDASFALPEVRLKADPRRRRHPAATAADRAGARRLGDAVGRPADGGSGRELGARRVRRRRPPRRRDRARRGVPQRRKPVQLRAELKRLLRMTNGGRSDGLELESFARCVLSEAGREGVTAFLRRSAPRAGAAVRAEPS